MLASSSNPGFKSSLWHVLAVHPWAGSLPSLGSRFLIHNRGQFTHFHREEDLGVGALWCLSRPGQLAAATTLGLASEVTGYGCKPGGAHDLLSPPGPHSALTPGLVLNPPTAPCALQGESPGWPEDPRQRTCLTGAQVRELLHPELPRDANDQEQVGAQDSLG